MAVRRAGAGAGARGGLLWRRERRHRQPPLACGASLGTCSRAACCDCDRTRLHCFLTGRAQMADPYVSSAGSLRSRTACRQLPAMRQPARAAPAARAPARARARAGACDRRARAADARPALPPPRRHACRLGRSLGSPTAGAIQPLSCRRTVGRSRSDSTQTCSASSATLTGAGQASGGLDGVSGGWGGWCRAASARSARATANHEPACPPAALPSPCCVGAPCRRRLHKVCPAADRGRVHAEPVHQVLHRLAGHLPFASIMT